MSVSPSGLRSAMQKAPTVFFLQWCSFKVSCSLSWKQRGLLALVWLMYPVVMMIWGRNLFLLTLKVLFLKEAQFVLFNT